MIQIFKRSIKNCCVIIALLFIMFSANIQDIGSVLANPPNKNDYMYMNAGFMTVEPAKVCLWKKIPLETYFGLISKASPLAPLVPITNATVTINAKLGKISRQKFIYTKLFLDKVETQTMTYTARKTGHETITVSVNWAGETITKTLEFDVSACKYKVHGSTDLTKVDGASLDLEYWQPMGTFDVSGTLVASEDGIRGIGSTNLFEDLVFTGAEEADITCSHTPPWQGSSSMEINADQSELENNGVLKLTLTLDAFSINSTIVACKGDEGGGQVETPEMHIATFDLDFDSLSADGGSTSLPFYFPAGRGELEMELTVSPEAES